MLFRSIGNFIYQFMRKKKYGVGVFEMETFAAVVGGFCRGIIRVPVEVQAHEGIQLKLTNIHQYSTGSGKQRQTHRDVLWEDHKTVKTKRHKQNFFRTEIEVEFEIPSGSKIKESDGDTYYWELEAKADTPGVDLDRKRHV